MPFVFFVVKKQKKCEPHSTLFANVSVPCTSCTPYGARCPYGGGLEGPCSGASAAPDTYTCTPLCCTEVWGDDNIDNGIPPGFTEDKVNAGDVIGEAESHLHTHTYTLMYTHSLPNASPPLLCLLSLASLCQSWNRWFPFQDAQQLILSRRVALQITSSRSLSVGSRPGTASWPTEPFW